MKTLATLPACCVSAAPPLPESARLAFAERLKALADPTRIGIVNRLAGCDECCVCDLTEAFGLSQPTISHHLKILRDAGLVRVSRRGVWAYYAVDPEGLEVLRRSLDQLAPGQPAIAR